ncbi:SPRY domain-containing SOCS box protein 4 [Anabarilius grahami]|uniref:SPRY domain-containing SOCS box protein 4 n=1 Tax=Anabarilius grahami TaxID=495550 RepID=A0A3N0XU03_ANAGA|nr:SPRY domain-containing SOCS box protein 4 [Anabarilius grahami]
MYKFSEFELVRLTSLLRIGLPFHGLESSTESDLLLTISLSQSLIGRRVGTSSDSDLISHISPSPDKDLMVNSRDVASCPDGSVAVFVFVAEPLPLMDLCRRAARLALGRERLQEIETLPLPQSLKNYLQYQ